MRGFLLLEMFLESILKKVFEFDELDLGLWLLGDVFFSVLGRWSKNQISFSFVVLFKSVEKFSC